MSKKSRLVQYPNNRSELPRSIDKLFYNVVLDEYQLNYANLILDKDTIMVVVNARAGSGKTMIACGVANILVKHNIYDGIVYVAAPTQEQKQGFLPGSIEEKSAPYFEPMIQAMINCNMNPDVELYNDNNINAIRQGTAIVKCVPHTYLRGTNIENKVIIIDEAQNYYEDELQKTLTRIHDSCKVILIGHTGQIDLYKNRDKSGFAKYIEHFQKAIDAGDKKIKICKLVNNYRGWISNYSDAINDPVTRDLLLDQLSAEIASNE